jgi:hypothetical protein
MLSNTGSERKIVLYNGHISGDDYDEASVDEYLDRYLWGRCDDSDNFHISNSSLEENDRVTLSFYVLGKPLDTEPEAAWYQSDVKGSATKISGEVNYLGSETMTLEGFIFGEYDSESGVSEVDWYNACITEMKKSEETTGTTCAIESLTFGAKLYWYEYEIVLEPGERLKNAVVSPMYPSIDAEEDPYEYQYTYYLSPASCWANFGKLDIVINTPYEMSESSIEGFEKTENGYKLSRDGLPKDGDKYLDLSFTLLNDGNTPLYQPAPGFFERIASFFSDIFQKVVQFVKSIFN